MTSVNIDGTAIRAIREQKELTQLYLATVVGVTTDTISRWENRKYPSIKLENAEKLAEALGVDLEEILERHDAEQPAGTTETVGDDSSLAANGERRAGERKEGIKRFGVALAVGVVALAAVVTGLSIYFSRKEPVITAVRILPEHTAPGLPFPVMIRLQANQAISVPILLREVISENAVAFGQKDGVQSHRFAQNPRWIGRMVEGRAAFLYMVHPEPDAGQGEKIGFTGDCVSGALKKTGRTIDGPHKVIISRYHWADANRDLTITDEEVLDAYERYSIPGSADIDFTEVEQIWLAGGYRWDQEQNRIVPQ